MLTASFAVTVLTGSLTAAMFALSFAVAVFTAADFRMGRPPVKVLARCHERDLSFFARCEICRRRWSEFSAVRQVDFNSHPLKCPVGRVDDRTLDGVVFLVRLLTTVGAARAFGFPDADTVQGDSLDMIL